MGVDTGYLVNYVAEQLQTTADELCRQTKHKIKELLVSDVHNPNVLGATATTFDCIVTRFCIDSCSPDLASYKRAVKNVISYLKQGGYFLQMGFFNEAIDETTKVGYLCIVYDGWVISKIFNPEPRPYLNLQL